MKFLFSNLVMTTALSGQPLWAELESHQTPRTDGSSITWYLDRRGHAGEQGVVVLAQGSGCTSPVHGDAMRVAAGSPFTS